MDFLSELSSWCEIDASALHVNLRYLRRQLTSGALLGVVVKSNAYGHGMVLCAREFLRAGADWLVVNAVSEATNLRQSGIQAPLYICSRVPPASAVQVVRCEARVVICDPLEALALAQAGRAAGRPVRVHIKLETGTHRQGISLTAALELARLVERLEGVVLEGLTTHYADSENAADSSFTRQQVAVFEEGCRAFAAQGIALPMVHSANSAATLRWPQVHGSLVRVGLAAYGLWPFAQTSAKGLVPALSWRVRVGQLKEVPTGGYIGYGRTFQASRPMRIGILPVGYYEGFDRRLSNLAYVLVNGRRALVRGRICMDMALVDVSDIPGVETGTVATLLGRDGTEEITADQWAGWMGSINYEAVARIHPDQPRLRRGLDGKLEGEADCPRCRGGERGPI